MPSNPTRLTPAREAEIRARLAAATPGKWIVTGKDWRGNTVVTTDEGEPWHIAEVCAECGPDDNTPHNAAFIADAPTDLADVLAEVEALRADAGGAVGPAKCTACDGDGEVHVGSSVPGDEGFTTCMVCGGGGAQPDNDAIWKLREQVESLQADLEIAAMEQRQRWELHADAEREAGEMERAAGELPPALDDDPPGCDKRCALLVLEAEGADIAAVALSDDRDELRDVLRDLLEGLDWWGVDPTDREFPSDTIRTARAVLDSLNPDAARATAAPTTEPGGEHGAA